jgi:hypothetical protein
MSSASSTIFACWKEIDPSSAKNRGLLLLMRRHRHNLTGEQPARLAAYLAGQPALDLIYRFKQKLCYLLLKKTSHPDAVRAAQSRAFSAPFIGCAKPAWYHWCNSAKLFWLGRRKSSYQSTSLWLSELPKLQTQS